MKATDAAKEPPEAFRDQLSVLDRQMTEVGVIPTFGQDSYLWHILRLALVKASEGAGPLPVRPDE